MRMRGVTLWEFIAPDSCACLSLTCSLAVAQRQLRVVDMRSCSVRCVALCQATGLHTLAYGTVLLHAHGLLLSDSTLRLGEAGRQCFLHHVSVCVCSAGQTVQKKPHAVVAAALSIKVYVRSSAHDIQGWFCAGLVL